MPCSGSVWKIGSATESGVFRKTPRMLDHFLGICSAACNNAARTFSATCFLLNELVATLIFMHVPLFLNMYVHSTALLTCSGKLPVTRMGMGCFFFLKNDLPMSFGSEGRMRSSARKRSYILQSWRFASYDSYLVLSLDSPMTFVTPPFFSNFATSSLPCLCPSPLWSLTNKHTSAPSSACSGCGRASGTGLCFFDCRGIFLSAIVMLMNSSSSKSLLLASRSPTNFSRLAAAFCTCASV
mmetsp:Transcript_44428/g.132919  ORF Transcript_44428/g.132919 Transcript_44428/m.132919 type:complete len:240 (+) Transcript_44428:192-911(+)